MEGNGAESFARLKCVPEISTVGAPVVTDLPNVAREQLNFKQEG